MARFIFSLRDPNFRLLSAEAEGRGITIQELIRAVIIPDWIRGTGDKKPNGNGSSLLDHVPHNFELPRQVAQSTIGRLKP